MAKWNNVSLGELLTESNIPTESPDPNKRITVRLNVEGIERRPFREETKGATKYYVRKAGQFIYGKQNLHKGAFGIIPEELDGYESSIDLPSFDIDKSKVLPEWLMLILTKDNFYKELESIASGSATKRIHPERLFQVKIPLPSISEQKDILKKYDKYKVYHNEISNIIDDSRVYINKLRKNILQEAVQGKLVPQDHNDEPASVLLERITEEKERLINAGKIKKEKSLPPITEDEIPYELPEGWEWCRLQEAIDVRDGTHDTPKYVESGGYPLVTGKDFYSGKLEFSQTKYISKEDYEKIILRSKVDRGDILFSMIGGNIGSMVIFEEDIEIAIKNVALFKKYYEGSVDNKYLFYFLKANINNIKTLSKGGAQPFVSLNILRNYLFALPPFEEQKRIVEKVDQLMALCDELEKNTEQSKKDSELLMQSVLQEAFKEA